MTDDNFFGADKSRRSFMKEGALATGGLALGLSAGNAAAQEETETPTEDGAGAGTGDGGDAQLYAGSYYADAAFAIVSDALDWSPSGVESDSAAHMIRYLNTGEVVPAFVSGDASVGQYDEDLGYVTGGDGGAAGTPTETADGTTGNETDGGAFGPDNETDATGNETMDGGATQSSDQQPAVYRFEGDASIGESGLVSATFSTADAEALLEQEDWWQEDGGAADPAETETETETEGDGIGADDNETDGFGQDDETDGGFGADDNETGGGGIGADDNETGGGGIGPDNETGNESDGGLLDGNETETETEADNDTGGGFGPIFGGGGNDTGNDTGNDSGL